MKKRLLSFKYAFAGIKKAFISEPNMKIHVLIMLLVIVCGFLFRISRAEWMFCVICFALVFTTELINTAIEKVVDLVSPEYHPLAGKAKDIAAGAVLICAIFSAVTGLIIFFPKLMALIY